MTGMMNVVENALFKHRIMQTIFKKIFHIVNVFHRHRYCIH